MANLRDADGRLILAPDRNEIPVSPDEWWRPPAGLDVDAILLAGDIGNTPQEVYELLIRIRAEQRSTLPIVGVAGNHEWYETAFDNVQAYRDAYAAADCTFLENDVAEIGEGVRVLGCTLWTDLNDPTAESVARTQMNDFKHITKDGQMPLLPLDVTARHRKSVEFLKRELFAGDPLKTVVLTHHSPVQYGLKLHHGDERVALMDMYGAKLENLIGMAGPAVAFHGHTHQTCHRVVGPTSIMNNPRGYPHKDKYLNPEFDERFVFNLDRLVLEQSEERSR